MGSRNTMKIVCKVAEEVSSSVAEPTIFRHVRLNQVGSQGLGIVEVTSSRRLGFSSVYLK